MLRVGRSVGKVLKRSTVVPVVVPSAVMKSRRKHVIYKMRSCHTVATEGDGLGV
jgi:hypothetical protein